MISILAITSIALLYVHQQIELVRLSYTIDTKEKRLEDMLDHKESLEYNINDLESPSRLEKALSFAKIDIAFPRRSQIVRVSNVSPSAKGARLKEAGIERKVSKFGILDLFDLKAEAQAKEK